MFEMFDEENSRVNETKNTIRRSKLLSNGEITRDEIEEAFCGGEEKSFPRFRVSRICIESASVARIFLEFVILVLLLLASVLIEHVVRHHRQIIDMLFT
jgi:hypothetical protein